jgi:hypothetical protein
MLTDVHFVTINILILEREMSWDRTWRCKRKILRVSEITLAAERVASGYQGVSVTINKEAEECTTCFFRVADDDSESIYEISIYNMGKDGFVISLEADASDNHTSEDSDQLAEDLALELEAEPLEL